MTIRQKYLIIFLVSVLLSGLSILGISRLDVQGYALLPLVVLAGLSLFSAFAALNKLLLPKSDPVGDGSVWGLLFDLFFWWF